MKVKKLETLTGKKSANDISSDIDFMPKSDPSESSLENNEEDSWNHQITWVT
jgi:hypothetical protein